jgi:hypothetical protein
MVKIKRIGIGSAFKIGAIYSALSYAIFGLLLVLLQSAFLNAILSMSSSFDSDFRAGDLTAFSIGSLLIGYVCGIPFAAVFGGIFAAVSVFLYNLTSGWVGGLEVELDDMYADKPKPRDSY